MSIDTKFEIGSLSNPFTAMGIMIVQEKGKLSYEDNLSMFFPDFPDYARHCPQR
jgi:CubicO group peptidase (beta-lactamase class C family)